MSIPFITLVLITSMPFAGSKEEKLSKQEPDNCASRFVLLFCSILTDVSDLWYLDFRQKIYLGWMTCLHLIIEAATINATCLTVPGPL